MSKARVFIWGQYSRRATATFPTLVDALAGLDVRQISAGNLISAAVTDGGVVYTWGAGAYHALGHGNEQEVLTPRVVSGLPWITSVCCGWSHMVSLDINGNAWTWGYGGLGHPDPANTGLPGMVRPPNGQPNLPRFIAVAAGGRHSAALSVTGDIYVWGDEECFWNRPRDYRTRDPYAIGQMHLFWLPELPFVKVACGDDCIGGIAASGVVYVVGDIVQSSVFVEIQYRNSHNDTAVAIAFGATHGVIVTASGLVYQISGIRPPHAPTRQLKRRRFLAHGLQHPRCDRYERATWIDTLGDHLIVDAACGTYHTVLLTSKHTVLIYGFDNASQLGIPAFSCNSVYNHPTMVTGIPVGSVTAIGVGDYHCIALTGQSSDASMRTVTLDQDCADAVLVLGDPRAPALRRPVHLGLIAARCPRLLRVTENRGGDATRRVGGIADSDSDGDGDQAVSEDEEAADDSEEASLFRVVEGLLTEDVLDLAALQHAGVLIDAATAKHVLDAVPRSPDDRLVLVLDPQLLGPSRPVITAAVVTLLLEYIYTDAITLPSSTTSITGETIAAGSECELAILRDLRMLARCLGLHDLVSMCVTRRPINPKDNTYNHQIRRLLIRSTLPHPDLVFDVEHALIPCHRAVLVARCDYFRAMLTSGLVDTHKPIPISNISLAGFLSLRWYLYTGAIVADGDAAIELLGIACEFAMHTLFRQLQVYLPRFIDRETVAYLFDASEAYGALQLRAACLTYLSRSGNAMARSHDVAMDAARLFRASHDYYKAAGAYKSAGAFKLAAQCYEQCDRVDLSLKCYQHVNAWHDMALLMSKHFHKLQHVVPDESQRHALHRTYAARAIEQRWHRAWFADANGKVSLSGTRACAAALAYARSHVEIAGVATDAITRAVEAGAVTDVLLSALRDAAMPSVALALLLGLDYHQDSDASSLPLSQWLCTLTECVAHSRCVIAGNAPRASPHVDFRPSQDDVESDGDDELVHEDEKQDEEYDFVDAGDLAPTCAGDEELDDADVAIAALAPRWTLRLLAVLPDDDARSVLLAKLGYLSAAQCLLIHRPAGAASPLAADLRQAAASAAMYSRAIDAAIDVLLDASALLPHALTGVPAATSKAHRRASSAAASARVCRILARDVDADAAADTAVSAWAAAATRLLAAVASTLTSKAATHTAVARVPDDHAVLLNPPAVLAASRAACVLRGTVLWHLPQPDRLIKHATDALSALALPAAAASLPALQATFHACFPAPRASLSFVPSPAAPAYLGKKATAASVGYVAVPMQDALSWQRRALAAALQERVRVLASTCRSAADDAAAAANAGAFVTDDDSAVPLQMRASAQQAAQLLAMHAVLQRHHTLYPALHACVSGFVDTIATNANVLQCLAMHQCCAADAVIAACTVGEIDALRVFQVYPLLSVTKQVSVIHELRDTLCVDEDAAAILAVLCDAERSLTGGHPLRAADALVYAVDQVLQDAAVSTQPIMAPGLVTLLDRALATSLWLLAPCRQMHLPAHLAAAVAPVATTSPAIVPSAAEASRVAVQSLDCMAMIIDSLPRDANGLQAQVALSFVAAASIMPWSEVAASYLLDSLRERRITSCPVLSAADQHVLRHLLVGTTGVVAPRTDWRDSIEYDGWRLVDCHVMPCGSSCNEDDVLDAAWQQSRRQLLRRRVAAGKIKRWWRHHQR